MVCDYLNPRILPTLVGLGELAKNMTERDCKGQGNSRSQQVCNKARTVLFDEMGRAV